MVLSPQVDSVNIHAAIIGPVVRQRNDQFHTGFRRCVDDFVETADVDRRFPVRPPALEDDFCATGSFAAVLGQTGWVVGGVLVVEAPGAENVEAGFLCGGETELDVCLVVVEGEVLMRRSACVVSLAGFSCDRDSHVCVATGEVKVLTVQFEFRARSRHEAFGGFAGKCCCCGRQQSEGGEAGQHRRARRSRISRR